MKSKYVLVGVICFLLGVVVSAVGFQRYYVSSYAANTRQGLRPLSTDADVANSTRQIDTTLALPKLNKSCYEAGGFVLYSGGRRYCYIGF